MQFTKFRTVVAIAVTSLALASPAMAQPVPAQPGSAHVLEKGDLEAWLDGMMPYALKNGDIAGMVISVVKDGQVVLQKGYGYADVARKTPMDPARTMVRAGSTSKLFTWTAVMQLVEQGKLDLDRDVNAYIDFTIPHQGDKAVTLRDLMNHRAGFEEGLKDILATDPDGLQSTEQYLKAHPRPFLFTPGTVPAYSNYGASLAGYIIERVSGEPFEAYVERHILLPLGMNRTSFYQPLQAKFRADVSQGYVTASGAPQPYELVVTRPAGSGTTTAADMANFMIAHLQFGRFGNMQILSAKTEQLMQSPSEKALPGFGTMAHGFFHDVHNGTVVIGHGGDTVVFHTELDLLPQKGVGIYYTFNSRGKQDAVYGLRQMLFDNFMDRYFPAVASSDSPPTMTAAAQDAQAIAGSYESSRRVEHGFLSLFYLLQQTPITANADGTINGPGAPGVDGTMTFREVGPQLWHEVGGTRQLALTDVDGVKTVVDSADPISVLQAVPALRSSSLNLTILLGSVAILLWSLVLWPLSPLLRSADGSAIGISPALRRVRWFALGAIVADVVYLFGWAMLLQPVLGSQLQVYSYKIDGIVRTLQIAGILPIAAIAVGAWGVWQTFRLQAPWPSRVWAVARAAALLGIVWIAAMGNLLSFNLNY